MTDARTQLREGTAELHDRVDALFGRLDLADDADYRRFLAAHMRIVPALEHALGQWADVLPDWDIRRRAEALRRDFTGLGGDPEAVDPIAPPPIGSPAGAFGAAYVLEGSRLGGRLLERGLPEDAPRAYLAAPQAKEAWRNFLQSLNSFLDTSAKRSEALSIASAIFRMFEKAANETVE